MPASSGTQVSSMTVWEALGLESAAYLSNLVRINTVNPPGNERAACDYLAGVLTRAGVSYEIFESSPGRANLIARLKGDGTGRPILLLSHLDTVGVERERWNFAPFAGERREGYILGRGSVDDKSMTAAFLAAL
ncbi:MAG: M20/M25/M40 family metallo-hydrolase, partial [Elusimicrobiota bacterium]